MKQAILLIGFGGPKDLNHVKPFLESVTQGRQIPESRLEEVRHHYESVGGSSPYCSITLRQKLSLEKWLEQKKILVPVLVGFRHSKPPFAEALDYCKKNSIESVVGFVLSSFRCEASFERYQEKIVETQTLTQTTAIKVSYTEPFYQNPLFVESWVERIEEKLISDLPEFRSKTYLLFTAHSIPLEMSQSSGYHEQFMKAVELVVKKLNLVHHGYAYQSRSGHPGDVWLGPNLKSALQAIDKSKFNSVLFIPIGFLSDNVEIIYDLDIEAKKMTEDFGFHYSRVPTVMDQPKFIELLGELVCQQLK